MSIIVIAVRCILLQTYMYNDLFLYNCKTSEWTLLKAPNAPAPRCAHQVTHSTHHCSLTVIELGCKAEHLYSALHGIQTTLKRAGMDHTVLPATNTMPALPRKRSPDGATQSPIEVVDI